MASIGFPTILLHNNSTNCSPDEGNRLLDIIISATSCNDFPLSNKFNPILTRALLFKESSPNEAAQISNVLPAEPNLSVAILTPSTTKRVRKSVPMVLYMTPLSKSPATLFIE